jgi:Reverse transcriptase (RNA-dependent DNA polymerase)
MLHLRTASLDWALAHALQFGDGDVFPRPFEYQAVQHDWANVRSFLKTQDILQWNVRPQRTVLSPKAKHAFRVITQLDPLDFIVFAATIYEIASDVEARRQPVELNTVFSYRYLPLPDGQLFDPEIGYQQFQEATQAILEHGDTTHIVVADIADFYPRIYLHRLENALQASTSKTSHVNAIRRLLSGWNGTESFGIPVGSAPVRLLAEITIADVDDALLANGIRFVRFNDDYRLFARSYAEAYRQVAFLADVLFTNHGLTLQPQKTTVVAAADFPRRFLQTLEEHELTSLQQRFATLLKAIGIDDQYGDINYDDLPEEFQAEIDSMNLAEVLRDELTGPRDPDEALVRFVLRRLAQFADDEVVDDVLASIESLLPVFPDVIRYLAALREMDAARRARIGGKILDLVENSIISESSFHRMWALDLFATSTDWNNDARFFTLLASARDQFSRRKLILAMGRTAQRHWFQARWRALFDEPHWPRRALLAAASCMAPDARRHWYQSVEPRLDPLERAVMRWARQNPLA